MDLKNITKTEDGNDINSNNNIQGNSSFGYNDFGYGSNLEIFEKNESVKNSSKNLSKIDKLIKSNTELDTNNQFNETKSLVNNNIDDELLKIELKVEHLFKLYSESTDFVLSYSSLNKIKDEPDLSNSKINNERKSYEKLDEEKLNNFNNYVQDYSNKILNSYTELEALIDELPNKEEYIKSESELKDELKQIKIKQQSKIESISNSVELAKETLKFIEHGQQTNNLFYEL